MSYAFSKHAESLLKNYYMDPEEKNPQEAFRRAAYSYTKNSDLAARIYEYACKGWFMFSSPILSNANRSGLPISCFLTYVDDSLEIFIDLDDIRDEKQKLDKNVSWFGLGTQFFLIASERLPELSLEKYPSRV